MLFVKQEKISKTITGKYSCDFIFPEDGIYLIEIVASAKSWWQNFKVRRPFFKDDDIFLYFDNQEITTSPYEKDDARSVWNGNQLKGLKKTVIVVANIVKGRHIIYLKPNQSPYLESLTISKVEEKNKVIYFPVNNNPAQKSEGRPWLSYVVLDLFVSKLSISAKADKKNSDDDDIKLIINGQIQKNENTKSHRDWYWCGKVLKGADKIFSKTINLKTKQFSLDLYSDSSPRLSKIEIEIQEPKRIPTVDNPLWTGSFEDDTDEMILARAIFGEGRSLSDKGRTAIAWSIKNRVEDKRWKDSYHGVILQQGQYDAFKIKDPNRKYVENPFYMGESLKKVSKQQIDAWIKCYEIAELVIAGKIADPTSGANHYFSDYVSPPYWTKGKNAKFIMKIGNTLFYNLKPEGREGFIKIKYLVLALLFLLFGLGLYLAILWQLGSREPWPVCEVKEKKTRENINSPIAEFPWAIYGYYDHIYINPKTSELERIFFDQDGRFSSLKQLTNNGYHKSNLQIFSSNSFYFGYFQDLHKSYEDFDEKNEKQREEYYKNYTSLMINQGYGSEPVEVFRGDVHTSDWEWEDADHVKVYNSCGTCCRYYYLININTKVIEEEGHLVAEEKGCIKIN